MSDPTFSDIDYKNKMAWVWTTLHYRNQKLAQRYGTVLRFPFKVEA